MKSEFKKDDCVTLHIEDIGTGGEGIGKADGFTFFVKDAIVGDVIEAKIMKLKKNYGYARLMKVLTPSKDRVEPKCPVARQCGGCQIQEMRYEAQLAFKQKMVQNNLERIGGLSDFEMYPVIGMETPYAYRNKAQFPVGEDKDGNIVIGFYAGRTHHIVEQTDCCIGAPENGEVLRKVKAYMKKNQKEKIKSYRIIKDELKTTGGQIGNYLIVHKKEIIELSDKNAYAQAICNYFGWLNKKITIEDVLKEINEYLQNQKEKITSYATIADRLKTTGGQIGIYLYGHKKEIIELAIIGNSDALYICNYFKSFQKMLYKKIDEIANADSHFQNVVDNLEKGKENIDGRKLH